MTTESTALALLVRCADQFRQGVYVSNQSTLAADITHFVAQLEGPDGHSTEDCPDCGGIHKDIARCGAGRDNPRD